MNKVWAMLGLVVLQLLALFYGKDPSIFSAAILLVIAMPNTAQITVVVDESEEKKRNSA